MEMAGTTIRRKTRDAAGKVMMAGRRGQTSELVEPTNMEHQVRTLRERLGVTQQVLARVTGFSPRTIAKWEQGERLTGVSRQRIEELRRLQEALERVMNADFIPVWLMTPAPAFDGLKPIEVIERGEVDRIWRMIFQFESGVAS
jgi:transcriptional regulator with XRE-family HTH domain